jgi:hypothetical protein
MTAFSDYAENKILDHILRGATAPWDTSSLTPYVALFTADDGLETGIVTGEVANLYAYARTAVTFGSAAAGGAISNTIAVVFPAASGGNWGDITHCAIVDSGTFGAGNVLFHGALSATRTINDTNQFSFAIGDMTVQLD